MSHISFLEFFMLNIKNSPNESLLEDEGGEIRKLEEDG